MLGTEDYLSLPLKERGMPSPLDEEEINEIIDMLAETEDLIETIEKADHSEKTVRKYVKEAVRQGDKRISHLDVYEEEAREAEWTGEGPNASPFDRGPEDDDQENYAGMQPGDFLHDFFEDFEVGLKKRWVEIQARRADRRGVLPSREQLKADILNMSSGISQSSNQEAEYIAEEYWAEAKRFFRQAGPQYDPRNQPHEYQQGYQNPYGPQQGNGHGMGMQSQQQGGVGFGSQPDPQQQMMQMMIQELRSMREELREAKTPERQPNDETSTLDRLKELKEEKEILEELSAGDEHIERLERQIQSLQTQIAQNDNAAQQPMPGQGGTIEERLIELAASSPDVSFSEVMDVIKEREGVSNNPEVIKAQKEAEIREKELEHETRRYERLGEVVEDGISAFGRGFGDAILQSGEAETQTEDEDTEEATLEVEEPASEPAQPEPEPEPEICDECGDAEMIHTEVGTFCPNCEHGYAQCDICHDPLDVPGIGSADYGACPECNEVLDRPDDLSEEIECAECEWTGMDDDLEGEFLKCDGCSSFRPIERLPDGVNMDAIVEAT